MTEKGLYCVKTPLPRAFQIPQQLQRERLLADDFIKAVLLSEFVVSSWKIQSLVKVLKRQSSLFTSKNVDTPSRSHDSFLASRRAFRHLPWTITTTTSITSRVLSPSTSHDTSVFICTSRTSSDASRPKESQPMTPHRQRTPSQHSTCHGRIRKLEQ